MSEPITVEWWEGDQVLNGPQEWPVPPSVGDVVWLFPHYEPGDDMTEPVEVFVRFVVTRRAWHTPLRVRSQVMRAVEREEPEMPE